jgi:hypothetical protein
MWVWNLVVTVREKQDAEKNIAPNREKVTGDWRKVCNEELHGLYISPNIIRVVKSRKKRWAEHVACVGEKKN